MHRTVIAIVILFLTATVACADIEGAWTLKASDKDPNRIQLNITYGRSNMSGSTYNFSELGLSREQAFAAQQTPVRWSWQREAGTIAFEGVMRNGRGGGQMTFTPNRGYLQTIRAMGVPLDMDTDDETLFALAKSNVSTAYIRSMKAEGFDVSLEKYMTMAIFNVTPEYVREMRSLLGRDLSADKIVETRIHKVTPEYIREMRAAGWNLSLDDLVQSRIFKVTPEFVQELSRAGYTNLDHDDLVQFRIHKITPEYIRELRELGYTNIPADRLVEMRIHKVTPEFIRQLADAGYRNIPVRKLIEMRIHRIDPQFIDRMNKSKKD
jgi:hypothetical protein